MTFNPFDRGDFRWHAPTAGNSPDGSSAVILPDGEWRYHHRGERRPTRGNGGGQEAVMEARAKRLRAEEAR